MRKMYLFLLGLVPGYACAWLGHFLIEKTSRRRFNIHCGRHGRLQNDRDDAHRKN
jgi:hypothetical protein